ncbi:MAG: DUF4982 domain-containing protein [Rikenellaceae bacterium]|nr:DUF4982 domain-containing protein [Rikenellaceae bacterium]
MKLTLTKTVLLFTALLLLCPGITGARDVMKLEYDWKFTRGDVSGSEKPGFNDASWETVDVPHDWAIKGPFDLEIDSQVVQVDEDGDKVPALRTGRTGALPFLGVGWYRKSVDIPSEYSGKRFYIEFDGAMSNAEVFINGTSVGFHPYGYTSFGYDITEQIKAGSDNIIAVRLENKEESSRWYPGGGLYRNVRLVVTSPIHVAKWGTFVRTPVADPVISEIIVSTDVENHTGQPADVAVITEIKEPNGKLITKSIRIKRAAEEKFTLHDTMEIYAPILWSPNRPALYTVVTSIIKRDESEELLDQYETPFGIRSVEFDTDKGFIFNGEITQMKGVCLHHDLGPLGAAVNYRATERQIQLLKSMGCNAIRTAHNPASPELIQLCDRMGMFVIEEAFDEWKAGKNKNGYSLVFDEWAGKDIISMIHRDRNSPSIVLWSIGNEIREQVQSGGGQVAKYLADICRREDPTRLTTAGFDRHRYAFQNGLAEAIDVVGFNYKPHDYAWAKETYPGVILYGSETASTVSSRGHYVFPVVDSEKKSPQHKDSQASSYDTETTSWATLPDTEFAAIDDNDFVFGEFVWTGFDYLGEPSPYNDNSPARSSYFGILDLAGLPKDRFYLYKSRWSNESVLHLLPHWSWDGRKGEATPVYCYTNYPKAELFVNGKSHGVKEKSNENKYTRYRLIWDDVVYEPGEIKVVAYDDNGNAVAETSRKTEGKPYKIELTADRINLDAGSKDLSFVTVKVVDKDGNLCPMADNEIKFSISGAGELQAVCNGDATSQVSFASDKMPAFNGMLVAIVKTNGETGDIELTASSPKLKQEKVLLSAK